MDRQSIPMLDPAFEKEQLGRWHAAKSRELKILHSSILGTKEDVLILAASQLNGIDGLLVLTSWRLMYLSHPYFSSKQINEYPIAKISEVESSEGIRRGSLSISMQRGSGKGKRETFSDVVPKERAAQICSYIAKQVEKLHEAAIIREQMKHERSIRDAERIISAKESGTLNFDEREAAGTYPSDWGNLRKAVYSRDGYKCANCGLTGAGVELHAHHIVPLSAGGSNAPSNLITLCRDCHRRAHSALRRGI